MIFINNFLSTNLKKTKNKQIKVQRAMIYMIP